MTTQSERSRREYHRRINAVIDHIERHLGEDLTLEDLARVAHFSPWHFHRVFTAVTGETVMNWIKRQRVQTAADRLRYDPDLPVTTLAYELGFSSPSVLNRAFRDRFGYSPTEWRERGHPWDRKEDQAFRNHLQARDSAGGHHDDVHSPSTRERTDVMSQITVHDLPAYRIAYLRRLGPYEHEGIGELWGEFARWAGPRGLMGPGHLTFGVSHDNPEVTPPEKCRYDAGVAIDADFQVEGPVTATTLPAGKYAVLKVRCVPDEIGQYFGAVFQWLTESGWQPDHRPSYQRYGDDCQIDEASGEMTCDICVPVRPL